MTDDSTKRPRYDEEFVERGGGWQKPVKPPAANAMAPGPQPKAATPPTPATEKESSSDG